MLSKEVCKACTNAQSVERMPNGALGWLPWMESDELRWEHGFVCCRIDERFINDLPKPKVEGKPPKWCKYVLEHEVSQC